MSAKPPKVKPPKNLTGKTVNGVRPNNRKPYKKSTVREIEEIVDAVCIMLVRQFTKTQIHTAVENKFNKDWSTTDRIYIPRAKERLAKQASQTKEEAKSNGIGVLLDILRTGTAKERIMAERRLSEIHGYNAPTHHTQHISTPIGEKIVLEHKSKEKFDLDEFGRIQQALFGIPARDGNGEPIHPPHANGEAGGVSGANGS